LRAKKRSFFLSSSRFDLTIGFGGVVDTITLPGTAVRASYGIDCPAIVAYRASRPDELPIRGALGDIRHKVKKARITRTALVLVGPALAGERAAESRLYAADHITPWARAVDSAGSS
jgi:precorrin-4 methylase